METPSSNLANNLFEGVHRIKCKLRHYDEICEIWGIKYKYCDCFPEYINFKDNLIEYKCLCCNKNYQYKCDEKLKERFFDICKFSNRDNNTFIWLLQKCVYLYEYIDDLEKINETSLPEKENFYSHLSKADITGADYKHAKRVCKYFKIKN